MNKHKPKVGDRCIWSVSENYTEPGTVDGYNRYTDRYSIALDSGTYVSWVREDDILPPN